MAVESQLQNELVSVPETNERVCEIERVLSSFHVLSHSLALELLGRSKSCDRSLSENSDARTKSLYFRPGKVREPSGKKIIREGPT